MNIHFAVAQPNSSFLKVMLWTLDVVPPLGSKGKSRYESAHFWIWVYLAFVLDRHNVTRTAIQNFQIIFYRYQSELCFPLFLCVSLVKDICASRWSPRRFEGQLRWVLKLSIIKSYCPTTRGLLENQKS